MILKLFFNQEMHATNIRLEIKRILILSYL